jgi:hypothetical protein
VDILTLRAGTGAPPPIVFIKSEVLFDVEVDQPRISKTEIYY